MKAMKSILVAAVAIGMGAGSATWGLESSGIRLDSRGSYGGRVGTGVEMVGEVDGSAWRAWDTTEETDGWVQMESQGDTVDVCVLNEPAVEGGRLEEGTYTWGTDRVHVVRDDVVVGDGTELTLEFGAVVKFTDGARIVVEDGGTVVARGAYLADVADDAVGGDTNLDGDDSGGEGGEWWLDDDVVGALSVVELMGGGAWPKRTYSVGMPIGALPEPSASGALFGGWYPNPNGLGTRVTAETVVGAGRTVLYAKWIPMTLALSPSSVSSGAAGGTYSIAVEGNTAWEATTDAPWVSVSGGEGDGDGSFSLLVAANRTTSDRACTVRVATESEGVSREVSVSQEGMVQVATPVVLPADGTVFHETSQRVVIICATAGARIYYTLDGSIPDENAIPYAGSFNVFATTTVKARAYLAGALESAVAESHLVRELTLAEAINQPLWNVVTDQEHPWSVVDDITHDGQYAARSGAVINEEVSRLETSVEGSGELVFWWKVDCEDDPDGTTWDRLSFYVDNNLVASIDGSTEWTEVSARIKGTNVHALVWEYAKDFYDESETSDCGWIDQVVWNSSVGAVGVPVSWLSELGLVGDGMSESEAVTIDADGDGFPTAQEWLAGTDPTDGESYFYMDVKLVDGQPVISWSPDLEGERNYQIEAKQNIQDDEWTDVTDREDPVQDGFQFYRVKVSLSE